MNRMILTAAVALSLYAGQAGAQTAIPVPPATTIPAAERVHGIVASITDKSLTLTQEDGTSATVAFLANPSITLIAPATLDQILPGSHVTSANKTQPDGTGLAREIGIFPPGAAHHDANLAIGDSGTMLTSGTVTTVVTVDGGRIVTVDYGSGTRQITVPGGARITTDTPATRDQIRPGAKVYITTRQPTAAYRGQQTITIFTAGL